MPLTPNDSQNLAKLTGEVTRVVNTIDDLMDLLADSGGQGADIWAAIAAHNNDPNAHGALIADKVAEAVDDKLDDHNGDPEAHKDVIAEMVDGAVDGILDAHKDDNDAHKDVIGGKVKAHNEDSDAHKDLFADAAVPDATTTAAGKVVLATATDKDDPSKVPPAAVVQGWLAETGGGFTTLEVITTSGTFTAKKTGYHRITCIGGGGGGGRAASGANAFNGATGGITSVSTITAPGGDGGYGGQNNGGGGGGAGLVTIGYLYLMAGDDVDVIIGAGAGVSTTAGKDGTGRGAPGASNGAVTAAGTFRGGAGGRNDYGHGNGGNGAASGAATGLDGSNGAVFIEY